MNNEDNCKCCHDSISFGKRHLGKLGVSLGVCGLISSVLIGLEYIEASAIVLGITNLGIIIGAIFYERLQKNLDSIHNENSTLKDENKQLTEWKNTRTTIEDSAPDNDISASVTIPDPFDTIYYGSQ